MRLSDGTVLLDWPLAQHVLTAGYLYNDGSPHNAIDLRAPVGTPVYAAEDGTVDWAQNWDGRTTTGTQSYGNALRIRHAGTGGRSLQTRYAHLSQVLVQPGDRVRAGQLVGYSGDSGNVSGPHLHFEVILDGVRRNPLVWLDDDFTTASPRVYTYAAGEGPVRRPAAPAAAQQTVVLGPLTDGDAQIFEKFARWLGLTDRGLYRAEAAGSGGTRVVLGPVSAGDAEMARQLADYLGLNDRGLLKIEPAV